MDALYCPRCGKKTFCETGRVDREMGDQHICRSCGSDIWLQDCGYVNITVRECPTRTTIKFRIYAPYPAKVQPASEEATPTGETKT